MVEEIVLTIEQILNNANTLCDDNINHKTLLVYFNKGIDFINAYSGFKFPLVSPSIITNESNAANIYDVCTQVFANNKIGYVLMNYVAKCIKEVDGYSSEANEFSTEFNALLVSFSAKYRPVVKEEYLLSAGDGGNLIKSSMTTNDFFMKRAKLY